MLSFTSAAELEALTPAIGDAIICLATAPQSLGYSDTSAYEAFTASAIAQRFGRIFDGLAGEAGATTSRLRKGG